MRRLLEQRRLNLINTSNDNAHAAKSGARRGIFNSSNLSSNHYHLIIPLLEAKAVGVISHSSAPVGKDANDSNLSEHIQQLEHVAVVVDD